MEQAEEFGFKHVELEMTVEEPSGGHPSPEKTLRLRLETSGCCGLR